MNGDIVDIAKWARSQGWAVDDDSSGNTRFYNPEGIYVAVAGAKQERTTRAPGEGMGEVTTDTGDWVLTFTFDADTTIETMDEWRSRLADLDGSVARVPGRGIDVTVYAPASLSIPDAIAKTIDEVTRAVEIDAPIGLEIITEAEQVRRAKAPTMPELMSAAEIAEELGVARQRVHQLRQNAAFPAPLADLRGGAVWDAAAVRRFAQGWDRRPGRPRRSLRSW